MRKRLAEISKYMPFAMLLASLVSNYMDMDKKGWVIMGNSVGYSLLTGFYMLCIAFAYRHCTYTVITTFGLILLNLVCLAGAVELIEYEPYAKQYDTTIIGLCLLLCVTIYLRK